MTDFLLELRSEEIPARMQVKAKDDLARLFAEEIAKAGLVADNIETFATPRRLALIARGLPAATEATAEERKGPRANAPEAALAGFLRSTGLTRDQLVERDGVLFAIQDVPGQPTQALLSEAIRAVVHGFPWPKSMRWGEQSRTTTSLRWVRPLQGIVALFGDAVVDVEIDGIRGGAATMGHRFHHAGSVTIAGADRYVEQLRAAHVIVGFSERCALIRDGARAAAATPGLTLVEDEGLVVENAGLTEWPVPLLGRFDAAFLDVPREVIQLTMRTNQKYFACVDGEGALANAFVCTANIEAVDPAVIVAGNAKVLAARLSDAKFFWETDLKVPLGVQAEKLKDIVFHEKLGTVADKVERVAKLARWLCEEGIVKGDPDLAERAARLCKADLVTGMVGEFPELQGIIGGHLARAQGEDAQVADAIRDHYKPVGQGDAVPTDPVTVAVSLADKLDTITAFFAIDEKPTGSKDPFALRRAALGALSIVILHQLRFSLNETFDRATISLLEQHIALLESYEEAGIPRSDDWKSPFARDEEGDSRLLAAFEFLIDRLKVQQREAGVRHDLIDAVFALGGEDDLVRLLARVKALQAFVSTPDGTNLLAGYKRASNILKIAEKDGERFDHLSDGVAGEPEERTLALALKDAEFATAEAVGEERFEDAMSALARLRPAIDAFFDKVMVNVDDTELRRQRLSLLTKFRATAHQVADFSKIEG